MNFISENSEIFISTGIIDSVTAIIILFLIICYIKLLFSKNKNTSSISNIIYDSLKIFGSCIMPFILILYELYVKFHNGSHYPGLVTIANITLLKSLYDLILFTYGYTYHKKNNKGEGE